MNYKLIPFIKSVIILLFMLLPADKVFSQGINDCFLNSKKIIKQNRKGTERRIFIKEVSKDIIEGKSLRYIEYTFSRTANKLLAVQFWEVDDSNNYRYFNVFWFNNDSLLGVRFNDATVKGKNEGIYAFHNGVVCYSREINIAAQDTAKLLQYAKILLSKAYNKLEENSAR